MLAFASVSPMSNISYAAFLGNQPGISLAELRATVPGFLFKRMVGSSIAIFETEEELNMKKLNVRCRVFEIILNTLKEVMQEPLI